MEGWFSKITVNSLGWLILMGMHLKSSAIRLIFLKKKYCICCTGLLYILGAVLYALRVPERWYPGKFDLVVSVKCN